MRDFLDPRYWMLTVCVMVIAVVVTGCPPSNNNNDDDPPETRVTVPNVVGLGQSTAQSRITLANLTVGTISHQHSATMDAGDVMSQSPGGGSKVPPNTPVNLVISQGPPEGPTAAFTMNHSSGAAPLIVQFEDQSTPGATTISSWSWAFDDPDSGAENASTFQNPSHVFNESGTYTVSLTVATAYGSDTVSHNVTVSLGGGEIVSQDVRVVDDIPTLSLDTGSGPNYTFTYTGNGVPPVEPGDILVGTEGEGYLRRVSAVKSWHTKANGTKSVAIATEFCSLSEAVKKGSLVLDEPIQFTADDLAKAGMVVTKVGAFVSLDGITLSDSFDADLYGQIGFLPSFDVEIDLDWWELEHLKMAASGTLNLDLGVLVSAGAGLSYSKEKSVFPALPPTHIAGAWVGPVPVVIVTQFDIIAGLALETAGSVSVDQGFKSATTVSFGAEFDSGAWNPITGVDISATPYGPVWTIEVEAGVLLYLKPEVRTRLYGVTGPSMAAVPYLGFYVEPLPAPLSAELRAGIDADLAFDLINLDIIDVDFAPGYSHTFEGPSYTIYEWTEETGVPDLVVYPGSVSLSQGSSSATVTVSNIGGGILSWTASSSDAAVTVSPAYFTGNSKVVTISTSDLSGSYTAQVTFTNDDNAANIEVVTVSVTGSGGSGDEETIMLPGNVPLEMVWIPAGTFQMGRYSGEQDSYSDEDPRHQVTLSQGFWMAKYELTKRQWTAVMGTTPWSGQSYVLDDPDSPAVCVSWNDAQAFIATLNDYTGKTFRLPTEAEWEYACRAGTTTRFYWGDDPSYTVGDDYCWWTYNAWEVNERYAHAVGQKLPNAFGLYDMSGNVWEWCQDYWYSAYPSGSVTDPTGPASGSYRVLRGGGWRYYGYDCRSAHRDYHNPSITNHSFGFRLSR